jgi:hypothetical protein
LTKSQDLFLVLLRLRPEAVTACFILAGPFLRLDDDAFSAFVIFAATAFGLQEGYGRLDSPFFADLRPQGLPVLTSTHSSLNHFLSAAPFLLFLTATFVTPVLSTYLAALSYGTRRIRRRPHFVTCFDFLCTGVVCLFLFLGRHLYILFFLALDFALALAFFFLGGLPTLLPYVPGPYGITISLPVLARPISCGEFARLVSITLVPSPKRLSPCWLIFFDLHLSVTKTYCLGLVAFLSYHHVFLGRVIRRSLWLVVPAYPGSLQFWIFFLAH